MYQGWGAAVENRCSESEKSASHPEVLPVKFGGMKRG